MLFNNLKYFLSSPALENKLYSPSLLAGNIFNVYSPFEFASPETHLFSFNSYGIYCMKTSQKGSNIN